MEEENKEISNTILFNGYIKSDPIDVGGGFLAFNIDGGEERSEMPLMLAKNSIKEFQDAFRIGDLVSGYGILKKVQEEWVIETKELLRIPNDDELSKMND